KSVDNSVSLARPTQRSKTPDDRRSRLSDGLFCMSGSKKKKRSADFSDFRRLPDKIFASGKEMKRLHCGYARMCHFVPSVFIRAYPRHPRFSVFHFCKSWQSANHERPETERTQKEH